MMKIRDIRYYLDSEKVISEKLSDLAYNSWAKYSKILHNNRGAAGGLLDRKTFTYR